MRDIAIGTSGWSYDDWVGPFYPAGTTPREYLPRYAERFEVVEVDSTYYRPPTGDMVRTWAARTPAHFRFALKVPGEITHRKVLAACEAEMDALLAAVQPLEPKLLCLLLQFGYFNRAAFASASQFLERLDRFLGCFAPRVPLAVEIRNQAWLGREYFELLRRHGVVAALVEHAWLPPVDRLLPEFDIVTGPFAYVRLIGDREGIEKVTTRWDQVVVDRQADLVRIAAALRQIAKRAPVFVFVNNHYAGHGPRTCVDLRNALEPGSGADSRGARREHD
jgi:uncharacterized protein YecE (DUF72 family)